MARRRSYGSYNDGCAAAHALDLIGERWTLLVVRELLLGPKRFIDIQRDVIGVGPAVLTQRLHELEAAGIARRRRLEGPGRTEVYELTAWGQRLEAVNTALSLWAVASPALPAEADMSPDTVVLAMRAHARPVPACAQERRVTLHLSDSRRPESEPVTYLARVSAHEATIERLGQPDTGRPETGRPGGAGAEVWATTADWKAVVIGGVAPERLPGVRVEGSPDAVGHLVAATSLHPAG